MKIFSITLLCIISSYLNAFSNDGTTIVVLGTVHEETAGYNSDTLVTILNRYEPDVIFIECDNSYLTSDFELKPEIKDITLETRAIEKYKKNNKVQLRAYDISGRDDFLDSYERKNNERNFFNKVDELYSSGKLSKKSEDILDKILEMMVTAERMVSSNAITINSESGGKQIDFINYYTYDAMLELINETPELSGFKSYWITEKDYWSLRNDTMIQNILNLKDEFSGKRILVLCGFSHKNLITEGIKSNQGIVIKNYWEAD